MNNKNRLFYGSCFALVTTALSFSIRAGILKQLGMNLAYQLSNWALLTRCGFSAFLFL